MINAMLKHICKTYDPGKEYQVQALKNVNLEFETGRSYAIMGASGSGKSTLLNILGCLDRPTGGEYIFGGARVDNMSASRLSKLRASRIGFILQDYGLIDYVSAIENCVAPCVFSGIGYKNAKRRALSALKQLGIEELAPRAINKLSGGQKQRVAIARAIINRPQLILADEPTGALDSANANMILGALLSLVNDKTTLVLVTHDNDAANSCDRVMRIKDGCII